MRDPCRLPLGYRAAITALDEDAARADELDAADGTQASRGSIHYVSTLSASHVVTTRATVFSTAFAVLVQCGLYVGWHVGSCFRIQRAFNF